MPFRKWVRDKNNLPKLNQRSLSISGVNNINQEERINNEKFGIEDISIVYLSNDSPIKTIVDILESISENETKVRICFFSIIKIEYISL
jgi:hypothetical protein